MRQYDIADIGLLKNSPMRWRPADWAQIGQCEGVLLTTRPGHGGGVYKQIHILIQRARTAFIREGLPPPWDDNYEIAQDAVPRSALQSAQTLEEAILSVMHNKGRTTRAEIDAVVSPFGYSDFSVKNSIQELGKKNLITRRDGDADSVYIITAHGSRVVGDMLARPEIVLAPNSKLRPAADKQEAPSQEAA